MGDTHHFVLADPFCGLDGPVQAGLADVHVLGVGIAGQQPQQRPEVDVVIIIHVAEPPEHRRDCCQGLQTGVEDCQAAREGSRMGHSGKGGNSLLPRLNETVILYSHLAGQSLAAVGRGAVGEYHIACGQGRAVSRRFSLPQTLPPAQPSPLPG